MRRYMANELIWLYRTQPRERLVRKCLYYRGCPIFKLLHSDSRETMPKVQSILMSTPARKKRGHYVSTFIAAILTPAESTCQRPLPMRVIDRLEMRDGFASPSLKCRPKDLHVESQKRIVSKYGSFWMRFEYRPRLAYRRQSITTLNWIVGKRRQ